jgi:hypothetical protein
MEFVFCIIFGNIEKKTSSQYEATILIGYSTSFIFKEREKTNNIPLLPQLIISSQNLAQIIGAGTRFFRSKISHTNCSGYGYCWSVA